MAEPDATLLCVAADDPGVDVFTVADEMLTRGWFVQPQLAFGSLPATLHLTISAATAASLAQLVDDLGASVAAARAAGPAVAPAELTAMLSALDPATLDEATLAAPARGGRTGRWATGPWHSPSGWRR